MARNFKRAPFISHVILSEGDVCHSCRSVNISQGGILLEDIAALKEEGEVYLIVSLAPCPNFLEILEHDDQTWVGKPVFFRAHGKFARVSEERSSLDLLFKTFVGVQFTVVDLGVSELIQTYVETMEKNIFYLISLIQKRDLDSRILPKIKKGLALLGMDDQQDLELAHKKLIRDYQAF